MLWLISSLIGLLFGWYGFVKTGNIKYKILTIICGLLIVDLII